MRRLLTAAAIFGLAISGAANAEEQTSQSPASNCFFSSSWQGWSAPGDGDVLLLRVRPSDVYRVELTPGTHVRRSGDRFLVNELRGGNWICSALDLDLTLSDHQGFSQPLIARTLTKLSAEEVAAIPAADLPH